MSELVFPSLPGLAWGMQKTPIWNTRVQRSVSGKRQAIGYMSYPNYKYTLNFAILREYLSYNDVEQLQGFFNQMKGQFDTFKFADPLDAAITAYQTIGTGDGVTKNFQLVRSYGDFVEPVQTPNVITSLRKASVAQTNPTHYTVSSTGVVQFVTAPAVGEVIDWTGTYYWRCAFTQDTLDLINSDGDGLWKSNKISFQTEKL